MKNIAKKVEAIREELNEPIPEPQNKEKKMATKKKKGGKKVSKKKVGAKKKKGAKKKGAKKKSKKTTADGGITLASLASEAGITGQKARQKLRGAGIERAEGSHWSWKPGSKELKKVRKALGL